jgi:hypothetical protein
MYHGLHAVEATRHDRELELRARRLARLNATTRSSPKDRAGGLAPPRPAHRRTIRDWFGR